MKEATVFFTGEEDRYGLLFLDLGRLMPFKISLIPGTAVGVNLKKHVWKKLPSRGNCKQYTKGSVDLLSHFTKVKCDSWT